MRSAARTTSAVSVVSLDQSEAARHSSNWSPPTSPPSMLTTRPNSSWRRTTWWSSTIPIGSSTPVRSKESQQQGRRRALPAPTSTGSPTARSWNSGSKVTCLGSCSNSASSPRQGREGSRSAGANGARQVVGVGSRQRVADDRWQPLLRRVILLPTRHGTKEPSMSLDEHKAILRASYEVVFNQHQVERAEEFYALDRRGHPPGRAVGHPAHWEALPAGWHEHLPPGRGQDRRTAGGMGQAEPDAAAGRGPYAGAGDTVSAATLTQRPHPLFLIAVVSRDWRKLPADHPHRRAVRTGVRRAGRRVPCPHDPGPAVLALVGPAAWWLPRWLDRLLPNLDIEGGRLHRAAERAQTSEEVREPAGAHSSP